MSDITTIFEVWDNQKPGYVALPVKGNTWREKTFQYPQEKSSIIKWIQDSLKNKLNIYWCPTVLNDSRRIADNIPEINVLYADLDEVNPNNIPNDLKPSMAWQTSNGRYAAIWELNEFVDSKVGENLNKRLTYYLNADKGGWDLSQVLRIPGLPNHKYTPAQPGKLLWKEDNKYNYKTFSQLPEVDTDENIDKVITKSEQTKEEIVYKYSNKMKKKALDLLLTPESEVIFNDRSAVLWELECLLVEAGMTAEEIYTVISDSVWNKYKDRKDEHKRLTNEINKAINHTEVKPDLTPYKRQIKLLKYSDLMKKTLDSPKWLIKDWWEAGSHGILAGEPKTYKSTVSTEIAISVASGKPLFNKYEVIHPGPVLIIQEENSEWLMQDRFAKVSHSKNLMGEVKYNDRKITIRSPEDLEIYMVNRQGFNLTLDEDKRWIERTIKELNPVLVIFDPIYLMFGDVESNSAKELSPVLQWLITLSTVNNTAIMLIHHFNKSGTSSRGGQRMLGSVTFHAWVQSAIYNRVAEGKKNTVTVEREFRSFKTPQNTELCFDMGEPGEMYYNVGISSGDLSMQDIILTLLEHNPHTLKDLCNQTSRPQNEIKGTLDSLIATGKVFMKGNKYFIGGENGA
jgi:hypothetical protein